MTIRCTPTPPALIALDIVIAITITSRLRLTICLTLTLKSSMHCTLKPMLSPSIINDHTHVLSLKHDIISTLTISVSHNIYPTIPMR